MRTAWAGSLLLVAFVLGGCSSSDSDRQPESPPSPNVSTVTLTVRTSADADPIVRDISCAEAGDLCGDLVYSEALQPVPPNTACTMIYGGPETATVVGEVDGKDVYLSFARTNGCELARWEALQQALKAGAQDQLPTSEDGRGSV